MSQQNISSDIEQDRARAVAEARAELMRLANEQGVKPFDFDDTHGEFWPEEESADDFLIWLRSIRDEGGHPRSLPE